MCNAVSPFPNKISLILDLSFLEKEYRKQSSMWNRQRQFSPFYFLTKVKNISPWTKGAIGCKLFSIVTDLSLIKSDNMSVFS